MKSSLTLISLIILYIIFIQFNSINLAVCKENKIEYLSNLGKDKPIKIGVVWSFELEKKSNYFKDGILLAVKELNSNKFLDRKIEVIFRDDKNDIDEAQKIANEFVQDRSVVAVIAHNNIDLAMQTSITYEYGGTIMLSPAISYIKFTSINFDYIFRNIPTDMTITQELASFANFMNFKKIVVLSSNSLNSDSLTNIFIENAVNNNLEIIYDYKFKNNQKDFIKILTNISPKINHEMDYDAIFIMDNEENIINLIKNARKYGIYAPFITATILNHNRLLEEGEELDGTIITSVYNPFILNQKMQLFIENFQKEYNLSPNSWSAQGYDAIMLLAKSIKTSDTLDPSMIIQQLKYMRNFNSIFGKYSLNSKGDVIDRKIFFKIIKNKKFKYFNFN